MSGEEESEELKKDNALLNLEVMLKDKYIKELEAKLHNSRQHRVEVNNDK